MTSHALQFSQARLAKVLRVVFAFVTAGAGVACSSEEHTTNGSTLETGSKGSADAAAEPSGKIALLLGGQTGSEEDGTVDDCTNGAPDAAVASNASKEAPAIVAGAILESWAGAELQLRLAEGSVQPATLRGEVVGQARQDFAEVAGQCLALVRFGARLRLELGPITSDKTGVHLEFAVVSTSSYVARGVAAAADLSRDFSAQLRDGESLELSIEAENGAFKGWLRAVGGPGESSPRQLGQLIGRITE